MTVTVPARAVVEEVAIDITTVPGTEAVEFEGVELEPSGAGVAITLGDDIQPLENIEVTIPLNLTTDDGTVAMLLESEDGSLDLLPALLSADGKTATASLPHLSEARPVTIAWNALSDAVLQSIGVASPKPDCVGESYSSNEVEWSVISPATAWMCVDGDGESVTVTATSNGGYPYIVSASPADAVATTYPEASSAGAADVTIATMFGVVRDDEGMLFPGGKVSFATETPRTFTVSFEVAPGLLYVSTLSRTLDILLGGVSSRTLDRIATLDCALDSGMAALSTMTDPPATTIAGIYRSFFSCVEPVLGDLPGPQRVLLGMISAAPQLLIGNLTGAASFLNGTDNFDVVIDGSSLAERIPADIATEFLGTWTGPIDQPGTIPYTTELTLYASGAGNLTGQVRYPELDNCSGYLNEFVLNGNVLEATENITVGSRCITVVELELTLENGQLMYSGVNRQLDGVLTKR